MAQQGQSEAKSMHVTFTQEKRNVSTSYTKWYAYISTKWS